MRNRIRRTIATAVAATIIAGGAPAALATDAGNGTPGDTTATTVPAKTKREQRAAYAAAMKAYRKAEADIKKAYVGALKSANDARRAAMKSAKGKKAAKAIAKAHASAVKRAKSTRDAALAALGTPPVKPAN